MNGYFGDLEQELRAAADRKAHIPWLLRVLSSRRSRVAAVILAALVIATPAFGAVDGWFSSGAPDQFPRVPASVGVGAVLPHGDRLLSLRVGDPDGGPPWGLRLVRTSRGDTCVQVGRVEDGELGSLGIDDAWHDDHLFHPIEPNDFAADVCGETDGAGNGFVSQTQDGVEASANASTGAQEANCQIARIVSTLRLRLSQLPKGSPLRKILERQIANRSKIATCPIAGERLIMVGLLGPDASSVTYRTPAGKLATESTAGGVGAYLIVLRDTPSDCAEQGGTPLPGGCGSGTIGSTDNLSIYGAVTKVTYRNGTSCSVAPPTKLAAAYRILEAKLGRLQVTATPAARQRLLTRFYRAQHVNGRTLWIKLAPRCPFVGFVNARTPRVTPAEVASRIRVRITNQKRSCYGGVSGTQKVIACKYVAVSFIARESVRTTGSGYVVQIRTPDDGGIGSGTGQNVHVGERLHFRLNLAAQMAGLYRGTVSFIPNSGRNNRPIGGLRAPRDSVTVGHFNFRITASGATRHG